MKQSDIQEIKGILWLIAGCITLIDSSIGVIILRCALFLLAALTIWQSCVSSYYESKESNPCQK